jgi:CDP-paratose 2-epimerase
MAVAIITGSGGLIGSESVRYFAAQGFDVVGIDNDMRAYFFGDEASTRSTSDRLASELGASFQPTDTDIRDKAAVDRLFSAHGGNVELVVHTAAQPSHDWAAREPHTDFSVNAVGTLNLLEAARRSCPSATFVFTSTNKVYGDLPNYLPLEELDTRWELPTDHEWYAGVPVQMSIDRSTHSLFGASKVAADVLVQEYGRYFGMPTVCFRGGCLTGPQHAGAQLHGFLAYLMKCTVTGTPYTIFGYKGKQVRDNIHAHDVVRAFHAFHKRPRPAAVYNLGGGRESNVSMLEAIELCQATAGCELTYTLSDQARIGDHQWYVSDLDAFKADYPEWQLTFGIEEVLGDIYASNVDRWRAHVARLFATYFAAYRVTGAAGSSARRTRCFRRSEPPLVRTTRRYGRDPPPNRRSSRSDARIWRPSAGLADANATSRPSRGLPRSDRLPGTSRGSDDVRGRRQRDRGDPAGTVASVGQARRISSSMLSCLHDSALDHHQPRRAAQSMSPAARPARRPPVSCTDLDERQ